MAFDAFERLVAVRYLRSRRQEGFISVNAWFSILGIALGVATLIIVLAVMNGFRSELTNRILGTYGHVTVLGGGGLMPDYAQAVERIRRVPGVVSAVPVIEGQVLATAGGESLGAVVYGIRPEDLARRSLLNNSRLRGRIADLTRDDAIIIGAKMAERFRLDIGGEVTLISPQGSETAFGTMPRLRTYHVVAIFQVGLQDYDTSIVYTTLPSAQVFFQTGDAASLIEVMIDDPDQALAMRGPILVAAGPGARGFAWQQRNASFFAIIQVQRNVLFMVLTIIIVVAAFSIVSTLIMLGNDKARGIAILRTMGATRGSAMRIFFMVGTAIGIIGTACGDVLGIAFARNIEPIRQLVQKITGTVVFDPAVYGLAELPARMDPADIGAVSAIAVALAILAAIYPALRAARQDPVEALRAE
jgi:lipoprotein-releasing system permease protein